MNYDIVYILKDATYNEELRQFLKTEFNENVNIRYKK